MWPRRELLSLLQGFYCFLPIQENSISYKLLSKKIYFRGGGLSVSIWVSKDLRFGLCYMVRLCLKGKGEEAKPKPDLCPASPLA